MSLKVIFAKMDMKSTHNLQAALCTILMLTMFVSCNSAASESIRLAAFTENYVEVLIYVEHTSEGNYILSATFTPPEGYHLYSKDIPLTGIDGVGRPTLLTLTSNSGIKATGALMESVKAQSLDFEPKELLVYPTGAVTLSLPVELPPGDVWIDDEVQVTYMACNASLCKPPVVGKVVSLRIPGADMLKSK